MVAGVLIKVEPKRTREVYRQLKDMEGVANIVTVFGSYDMVLMIRALDLDAASKLIARIREVEGIVSTETLIASTPPE